LKTLIYQHPILPLDNSNTSFKTQVQLTYPINIRLYMERRLITTPTHIPYNANNLPLIQMQKLENAKPLLPAYPVVPIQCLYSSHSTLSFQYLFPLLGLLLPLLGLLPSFPPNPPPPGIIAKGSLAPSPYAPYPKDWE